MLFSRDYWERRWATTYSCAGRQKSVRGNAAQSLTSIHTLTETVLLQEVLKRKCTWQPIACHNQCCSGVWGGEYETSVSPP